MNNLSGGDDSDSDEEKQAFVPEAHARQMAALNALAPDDLDDLDNQSLDLDVGATPPSVFTSSQHGV